MSASHAPGRARTAGSRIVAALDRNLAGAWAVLERDFLVLTSNGRYVALRTCVVVVLAFVTIALLASRQVFDPNPDTADATGRAVFVACLIAYPIVVQLVAPALAADAIAGERAADTLQLVLAAPVRPAAFVVAKHLSRLGAILVPLLGGFPIAAICFLYGGIQPLLFFQFVACIVGLASMAVAGAILSSAFARGMPTAVTGAYFVGLAVPWLLSAASAWAWYGLEIGRVLPDAAVQVWGLFESPWSALFGLGSAVMGRGVARESILPFLTTATLFTAVCLAVAAWRLAREARFLARSGPSRGTPRTRLFLNPVLERASYALPFRGGGWKALVVPLVVGGLTWLVPLADEFDDEEAVIVGLNFCTWTTFFVVVSQASQCIAGERQQGSLPLLLVTPLRAREIVSAKLRGIAMHAAAPLATGFAAGIVGVALCDLHPFTLVTWGVTTTVTLAFFAAIAVRASASAEGSRRATGVAFGVSLGGMAAIGLLLLVVSMMFHRVIDDDFAIPFLCALPPTSVGFLTWAPNDSHLSSDQRWFALWSVIWTIVEAAAAVAIARRASAALARRE